jgi:hypothetical protein
MRCCARCCACALPRTATRAAGASCLCPTQSEQTRALERNGFQRLPIASRSPIGKADRLLGAIGLIAGPTPSPIAYGTSTHHGPDPPPPTMHCHTLTVRARVARRVRRAQSRARRYWRLLARAIGQLAIAISSGLSAVGYWRLSVCFPAPRVAAHARCCH